MAIPLSKTPLTFKTTHLETFRLERQLSLPISRPKSLYESDKRVEISVLSTRCLARASSITRETTQSSSIYSRLEKEKERQDEEDEDFHTAKETDNGTELADRWREILGEDDWVGLFDPMDALLRTELIRYGEMAQACYDAFDYDPYSKYCGSSKYPRSKFFQELDMADHGYDVTRYLYATSNINLPNFFKQSRWSKVWSKNANWIGYVAVSNDEKSKSLGRRDITIGWRGTVTRLEWIADLMDYLRPISSDKIPCPDQSVKVESGFLDLYTDKDETCHYCKYSAREQILTEVKRLIEMYPDEELSITVTGHSLGAALAILSAYDIVETGLHVRADASAVPVCVFSFSGPRVGNGRFKERLEWLGLKVLRVVNVHDIVPKSPGFLINETVPQMVWKFAEGFPWSYSHVGVELALDHKNSPFLKPTNDIACAHNLEALLHLIDGYHGKGRRFMLETKRDIALVNKACDFLKDHHCVPPYWRQDENKGMVRNKDGRWVQEERSTLDDHLIHHHDMHIHFRKLDLSSSA